MLKITSLALCATILPLAVNAGDHLVSENPEKVLSVFEGTFGVTEGKRRNHTKGYCIIGEFVPLDAKILEYTNSPIFTQTSSVNGRVSHKGGKNNPPDNKFADYGLAFEITTPQDDTHIINMNTEDFFPTSTADVFIELVRLKGVDKAAVPEFVKAHPQIGIYSAHHGARDKTLTPYEGATYNSINSFYLVNDAGTRTAVRWAFVPSNDQGIVIEPSESFFFENMQANLAKGEVAWDMVVSLAQNGDDILDPAIRWSDDNPKITAAKLIVTSAVREADGVCDEMNFDPTLLTDGVEPSEDPMLAVRASIYASGIGRRLSEK